METRQTFPAQANLQEKVLPSIEADPVFIEPCRRLETLVRPPMTFKSLRNCLGVSENSASSVVISIAKPHTILSVSDTLAEYLGYTSVEITGRSINILHGPNTDSESFEAAVCGAGTVELHSFSCIM